MHVIAFALVSSPLHCKRSQSFRDRVALSESAKIFLERMVTRKAQDDGVRELISVVGGFMINTEIDYAMAARQKSSPVFDLGMARKE